MFQFLIGRVKTAFKWGELRAGFMFQFLIGRVKTKQKMVEASIRMGFQFLIGRVKTVSLTDSTLYLELVSIPHR